MHIAVEIFVIVQHMKNQKNRKVEIGAILPISIPFFCIFHFSFTLLLTVTCAKKLTSRRLIWTLRKNKVKMGFIVIFLLCVERLHGDRYRI